MPGDTEVICFVPYVSIRRLSGRAGPTHRWHRRQRNPGGGTCSTGTETVAAFLRKRRQKYPRFFVQNTGRRCVITPSLKCHHFVVVADFTATAVDHL